jgi:hypothetical protein
MLGRSLGTAAQSVYEFWRTSFGSPGTQEEHCAIVTRPSSTLAPPCHDPRRVVVVAVLVPVDPFCSRMIHEVHRKLRSSL